MISPFRSIDFAVLGVAAVLLGVLLSRRTRSARPWRATVTPLASIIGSGFLVVAPLLAAVAGRFAPLAMAAVCLLAHAVGAVIRHNIAHVEPLLRHVNPLGRRLARIERISDTALALAYVVSVAFYIRLLAAFALRGLGVDDPDAARVLASAVLLGIGAVGFVRGLRGLEDLEEWSVGIKLSVIGALLAGLVLHDATTGYDLPAAGASADAETLLRRLLGTLLVVQGFETSRYLGSEYEGPLRIRTMRWAQILSAAIYVPFVALVLPLALRMPQSGGAPSETEIIDLSRGVSRVLPAMLVLGALFSQFSAAVADTIGSGGLLEQSTRGRLPERRAYVLLSLAAVGLIWTFDVFAIVAIASRAFAAYYLVQTVEAVVCAVAQNRRADALRFLPVGAVLLLTVLFAEPVG